MEPDRTDSLKAIRWRRRVYRRRADVPLLDSETLFTRLGWLAALAQIAPEKYATQFAFEWMRIGQYMEYCEITETAIWASLRNATPVQRGSARAQAANLHEYRTWLERMRFVATRQLETAFAAQPKAVAAGLAKAEFQHEAEAATRFLATRPAAESQVALQELAQAKHPTLRHFAEQRLAAKR